jgi:hypothetical protein
MPAMALEAIWSALQRLASKIGLGGWLCIVCALAALWLVHDRNHWKAADARDHATAVNYRRQLDAETAKNKVAEKQTAQISKQLKDRTDEENRRIAGDADTLRLRGPGKAVCPPVSTAPSEHQQAAPKPDVTGPSLPPDERAAVPWNWLVQRAQEHDELLNEVQAWRDWHDQVLKVWPKTTEPSK